MSQDITELVGKYLSDDPLQWGRLASEVQWRRLQLLLLREILLELRALRQEMEMGEGAPDPEGGGE